MLISLIFAHSCKGVIGNGLKLPWKRLARDMQWFRLNTTGKTVLMGRKTYDSFNGVKLLDRKMIVVSRSLKEEDIINKDDDIYVCSSVEQGIELAKTLDDELMVIGGAEIYKYFIDHDLADKYFITNVHHSFEGDVIMPKYQLDNFNRVMHFIEDVTYDDSFINLEFSIYERKLK